MRYKNYLWGVLFGLCLSAFTTYVLLDTFVLTRVYAPAVTSVVAEQKANRQGNTENNGNNGNSTDNANINNANNADNGNNGNNINNVNSANNNSNNANNANTGNPTATQPVGADNQAENADATNKNGSGVNSGKVAEKQTQDTGNTTASKAQWTNNSYSDENISVTINEYRQYDTTVYVADVKVSSAEYLRTALARQSYGRNVTAKTSEMARENNAILAINGDYYGAQEWGYVLRNGVLYRDAGYGYQDDLVIYQDGSFAIVNEANMTAADLLAAGAKQILSFGPALVMNGQIAVKEGEEVGRAKASNPRTAIGIIDDLHYIFVVSDGRTNESRGLSLYQLAQFTQSLGAKTVYNLDGGGSSTMVFNGQVVNKPTTNGNIKERSVSDIVYIGYN